MELDVTEIARKSIEKIIGNPLPMDAYTVLKSLSCYYFSEGRRAGYKEGHADVIKGKDSRIPVENIHLN